LHETVAPEGTVNALLPTAPSFLSHPRAAKQALKALLLQVSPLLPLIAAEVLFARPDTLLPFEEASCRHSYLSFSRPCMLALGSSFVNTTPVVHLVSIKPPRITANLFILLLLLKSAQASLSGAATTVQR
jgi:hypothetical protein